MTTSPSPRAPRPVPPIAEVIFSIPLERSFHYLVPSKLRETLRPGMRVAAPFGRRELVGIVRQQLSESPIRELKPIRRLIDPVPVITDEGWALAEWLSTYYYCSLGEAAAVMVPSALRIRGNAVAGLEALASRPDAARLDVGGSKGPAAGAARPDAARLDVGASEGPAAGAARLTLTPHQQRALRTIGAALDRRRYGVILVHGVTGSGKTELYLRAIDQALHQGRGAICLVPEIALTPQTIDRFRERFGASVMVWHSRLSARQRADAWGALMSGKSRIAIGTRSAVFLPVHHLGLIVIDEEHERTYKQEQTPRYHAREVAKARARLAKATVLLGSATPSIESYADARSRRSRLVTLPERVTGQALPRVEIIDMREEMVRGRRSVPFSHRLQLALERTVERKEQAMLLLNRRGFARVAQCPHCSTIVRCTRCSVPLVYHAADHALICHYCNLRQTPGDLCSECHKGYLRFRGSGTERVESELHRLFPATGITRMDSDTTKSRESHRELYEAVKTQQVSLLVGTQMIAKGLDFPQVTLVGVVSADTALNLPDFRAGERTFSLLTQVAGRSGRGKQAGRVMIQTYCPGHYAIQAATRHDYPGFYADEIKMRRRLALPPWTHLIELTLRGRSRASVQSSAEALAAALQKQIEGTKQPDHNALTLLGPAPHRIPRLRRTYRVCVLLKGASVKPMVALLRKTLQSGRRFKGMPVTVDVDPL